MEPEVKFAVSKIVDDMVGIPPAGVEFDDRADTVHVSMDYTGLKEEWLELGEEVVALLERDFDLLYEVVSHGNRRVRVQRKEVG